MAWTKVRKGRRVLFYDEDLNDSSKTLDYDIDYAVDNGVSGPRKDGGLLEICSIRMNYFATATAGTRKIQMQMKQDAIVTWIKNMEDGLDIGAGLSLNAFWSQGDPSGSPVAAVAPAGLGAMVWGTIPLGLILGPSYSLRVLDINVVDQAADDLKLYIDCLIR